MDNDSTTITRVRATVDANLQKKSDQNHTKKTLVGDLMELSSRHRNLKNKKVRDYITRCFMYAMLQNQENPEQLTANLKQIVPHIYGKNLILYF